MFLALGDGRQHIGQLSRHLVPRQVDMGIMLQIPVHADSHIHPVVTAHHDTAALLVELEKLAAVVFQQLCLKLLRCSAVDAFEHLLYWIGVNAQGRQHHQHHNPYSTGCFHILQFCSITCCKGSETYRNLQVFSVKSNKKERKGHKKSDRLHS